MKHLAVFIIVLVTSTTARGIRVLEEGCYSDCIPRYEPVCGSDGNTYNSQCELNDIAGCRNTPELTKVKDRPCDVGKVVLLDSFEWNLKVKRVKIGSKSAITLNILANVAKGSDSLSGERLWKVGIFGSKWVDGFGERFDYVEQILTKRQASKQVKKGKKMKLKNIRTRFDLSSIGCDEVVYFCVELARDVDSSVSFELRAGILFDSIISCELFDCPRPEVNVERNDLPPTCYEPCSDAERIGGVVCGNNSVEYDSFCELTKAARCERTPVKLERMGECPPEVIVSQVFWTALARPNPNNNRLPLLDTDLYLFNEGSDIAGSNLWQVSLYGSANENGTGFRHTHLQQVLNTNLSSLTLIGGYPFNMQFVVPFNTYAVGCEDVPYFCLEFKRNPNASLDFVLKRSSGEEVILSCRKVPCLEPPDKVRLLFQQVRWSVAVANFRFNEASRLSLNISVDVGDNSGEIIGGRDMWRIGIYGSRDPAGNEKEKIGFIPQVLDESDAHYSPDVIPGQTLIFPLITTEFDISALGCDDYRYLCVLLAKDGNSEPDFEIANNANKRKVVSCRQVQCIGPAPPPVQLPTVLLSSLTWNLTIKSIREDGSYNVRVAVNVVPDADTDTIQGTGLWRIGLFLSNATSGVMARSQYMPDILMEADKAIPLINGQNLLFTDLQGVLNVDGVGCIGASLQYACLEFAQGDSPEPQFILPLGPSRSAITCRRLFCHQT